MGTIPSIDVEKKQRRYVVGCTQTGLHFIYDSIEFKDVYIGAMENPVMCTDAAWMKIDNGIFCISSFDNYISIYDANRPEKAVKTVRTYAGVPCISFNEVEPVIAVGLENGFIRLIDTREEENLNQLSTGEEESILCCEWSPSSTDMLICGTAKGQLSAFDWRSPRQRFDFDYYRDDITSPSESKAHNSSIVGLCFTEDGRQLASLDKKGNIKCWDPDTGLPALDDFRIEISEKEPDRKKKICYCNGSLLVPSRNAVVDPITNTAMVGHTLSVFSVVPTLQGFVTAGDDCFLSVWLPSDISGIPLDESDWSD